MVVLLGIEPQNQNLIEKMTKISLASVGFVPGPLAYFTYGSLT